MRIERAQQVAWAFHETLLEILRQLNRAAERRGETEGMDLPELERRITEFWSHGSVEVSLRRAMKLLVENGLVGKDAEPRYLWERHRMVGERYAITALGKSFLVRSISESERIP